MYLTDKVDLHSQNPMAKASSPNEFMAIPNGIRSESGGYYNYSKEADYWSSSESSENNAYSSKVRGEFKNILIKKDFDKRHGFSVRCIADHENIQGREVSGINTTAVIPKQEPRISRYDDKFVSLGLGFGLSANFSFVYPIDDFNSQWFKIRKTSYSPYEPSNGIAKVKQVSSTPTIGPHLAFLASIQFNKYLEIRFLPTLTIAARKLIYDLTVIQGTYIPDTIIPVPYYTTVIKYISTVGLSFPVDVKFKFPGSRQFRFYLVAGLAYGINFNMGDAPPGQSNAPLNSTFNNFGMSAGIGINFYRDRLKFGIELKNTYGFLNILEKDGYVYTESIKSIHSDIVQLTFTIERIMFLKRR